MNYCRVEHRVRITRLCDITIKKPSHNVLGATLSHVVRNCSLDVIHLCPVANIHEIFMQSIFVSRAMRCSFNI